MGLVGIAYGSGCSIYFYENQCYGPRLPDPDSFENEAGTPNECSSYETWNAGCYTFPPGAHFMETGDACGPGACMQVQFYNDQICAQGYSGMIVGSGCYNINIGYQPRTYLAHCITC